MTDDRSTILLVEDDAATRAFLADHLSADGFDVLLADDVRTASRMAETRFPDLVVLDVGLPGGSGLELLERIRHADGLASRLDPRTGVLVLSGRVSELDRVRAFEKGADDVLGKPFSYRELRLRLLALERRLDGRPRGGRLRVGSLVVDPASREVTVRGERVELAAKEFALLRALAADPTRVHTKEDLLRTIWGVHAVGSTRTLDSHACRLRQKLAVGGDRFVVNVWGVGYRLVDGAAPALEAAA